MLFHLVIMEFTWKIGSNLAHYCWFLDGNLTDRLQIFRKPSLVDRPSLDEGRFWICIFGFDSDIFFYFFRNWVYWDKIYHYDKKSSKHILFLVWVWKSYKKKWSRNQNYLEIKICKYFHFLIHGCYASLMVAMEKSCYHGNIIP